MHLRTGSLVPAAFGAVALVATPVAHAQRADAGRSAARADAAVAPPPSSSSPESGAAAPRDAIRRAVLQNRPAIMRCYEPALVREPTLRGRVTIHFVINPDGAVGESTPAESPPAMRTVAECIATAARSWRFPAMPGGAPVAVNYPFNLEPPGGAAPGAQPRANPPTAAAAAAAAPMPEEAVEIRRVVVHNLGEVSRCYEQGLVTDPALQGRVLVRFVIGADGAVTAATVPDAAPAFAAVGECIATAVRSWHFAAPRAGTVVVNYPFNLDPPEGVAAAHPPHAGRGADAGALPPEAVEIRRAVVRNLGAVNRCYEQGLATDPALQGRVLVQFVIAPNGAVTTARATQNTLGAPAVADCIVTAARAWRFPARRGGPLTVNYPFSLDPPEDTFVPARAPAPPPPQGRGPRR